MFSVLIIQLGVHFSESTGTSVHIWNVHPDGMDLPAAVEKVVNE